VILSLGVLKGQAGATTDPVMKPFSFNLVQILKTLVGSSLKTMGKMGYSSEPYTSNLASSVISSLHLTSANFFLK
jgi:hypothetical protein